MAWLFQSDVIGMLLCQSTKRNSWLFPSCLISVISQTYMYNLFSNNLIQCLTQMIEYKKGREYRISKQPHHRIQAQLFLAAR